MNLCSGVLILILIAFSSIIVNSQENVQYKTGKRRGRCFQTMWTWLRGEGRKQIEENIISVNPDNVRFFLYPDPSRLNYYQEIIYNDIGSLQKSNFQHGRPWKILIHGYTMSQFGKFPQNVKNAYLTDQYQRLRQNPNALGYNILVVDWGPLADPKMTGNVNFLLFYAFAVRNVKLVGQRVGEFSLFLRQNSALDSFENLHIIGFSLGAHVAGNAGYTITASTGEVVSRVTGLDPAGPNFYKGLVMSSPKLSKDAGKFVDVYHSNQGAFGTFEVLGHVDFYPNGGGPLQEYCVNEYRREEQNGSLSELGSCSHNRAPFYYAYSISSFRDTLIACGDCESYEKFKTKKCLCEKKAVFGEYCKPSTRGTYYIDINDLEADNPTFRVRKKVNVIGSNYQETFEL